MWGGEEVWGGDNRDNINNVQYQSNQNYHCEFPQYNEYILIIKKIIKPMLSTKTFQTQNYFTLGI
jgi:hypothetical protein